VIRSEFLQDRNNKLGRLRREFILIDDIVNRCRATSQELISSAQDRIKQNLITKEVPDPTPAGQWALCMDIG